MELFLLNLIKVFPKGLSKVSFSEKASRVRITLDAEYLYPFMCFLLKHQSMQFKQLVEMTAIDEYSKKERFRLVYFLLSLRYNCRVEVEVETSEVSPITSLTSLYLSSNWLEREVWDMFGVYFLNHPDLRRILTDYGFEGHPLRKDFPLTGYTEVSYDFNRKQVISKPVELTQEMKRVEKESPWCIDSSFNE